MRKIIFLTALLLLSCFSPRWTAHPVPEKSYVRCDPFKEMPQMIQVPDFPGVWQVVDSCEEFPREKTSIALSIFSKEWYSVFGNDRIVTEMLSNLMILWREGESSKHSGYDINGTLRNNVRLRGATMSDSMVIVYLNNSETSSRICESALVHELVHVAIWKKNGSHGDPDHLGYKYPGWTADHSMVIQKTNNSLCVLGI
tara:strand:+ start:898 stop:1494 length:597 start_codon:yes stop_codon:yes gene_type:complete